MIRVTLWKRNAILKAGTIDFFGIVQLPDGSVFLPMPQEKQAFAVLMPHGFVSDDLVRKIRSKLETSVSRGRLDGYDWSVEGAVSRRTGT
jgi:hypothetical protein